MRIQCALALQSTAYSNREKRSDSSSNADGTNSATDAAASGAVFDVVFQQRSTANYMTCSMAQISVQSVRWPATRFSGSPAGSRFSAGDFGAISKGVVDATIWVSPLCTSRASRYMHDVVICMTLSGF